MIQPGGTIALFGGGQLGRMIALAARALGYRVRALDPDPGCPALGTVDALLTGSLDDPALAEALATGADVVTWEIEKVAPASLAAAAAIAPIHPDPACLEMIQDRGRQKEWLEQRGFPVGPWRPAGDEATLDAALAACGGRAFVKIARGGYDGRGQVEVAGDADLDAAHALVRSGPCVVERPLALDRELSVLVARRGDGACVVYPPALNHHEHRQLAWSVLPAPLPAAVAAEAEAIARGIAESLGLHGLLAVEMFHVGGRLLVNELAPRTHNSYHGSIEGCVTSQFEQLVRAVCDLPLGIPDVVRPVAIRNLLGDLWERGEPAWERALEVPGVKLHLYGKREARPARKMGHLAAAGPDGETALATVQRAYEALAG